MAFHQETAAVHAGGYRDPNTHEVNSPIFTSSAYDYRHEAGTLYPRYFNTPNQEIVAAKIATLEQAEKGMVFSSGMAAISTAILGLLKVGDHILFQKELYGGTFHFAEAMLEKYGIAYTFVDGLNPDRFLQHIRPNTRMIYIETPSNPLLHLIDIEKIAEIAKAHQLLSFIDNTFASPVNQQPIPMGIDLVMHSGTKYLGGHSDLCFGALVGRADLLAQVHKSAINFGGSLNAITCSLIERSLKTLVVRVEKQNQNAMAIAKALQEMPAVEAVHYPGLESHPGYNLAHKQMKGFGGMLSFAIAENSRPADQVLDRLQLIKPAVSLGGVETIISSPMRTSHSKMSARERQKAGIGDNLLRLSVGIEHANDLIEDLKQAIGQA